MSRASAAVRIRNLSLALEGRPLLSGIDIDLAPDDRLLVTADRGEALAGLAFAIAGLVPSPWRTTVAAAEWSRDWSQFEQPVLGSRLETADLVVPARTLLIPEDLDTWFIAGTGFDELTFFGWREGRDPSLDATLFGLFDRQLLARPIYNLSGGEKQRLALAEACVAKPDCLVLLNGLGWLDRQHRGIAIEALLGLRAPLVFCDDHVDLLSGACVRRLHVTAEGRATITPLGAATPAGELPASYVGQVFGPARSIRASGLPGMAGIAGGAPGSPRDPVHTGPPLIEACGLSFVHPGFADVRVLDGATFMIPRARDVFLVGANGTGKSTLAALVCGLERTYRGSLRVWDRRLGAAEPRVLRERLGASAPQILFQFVDDNLIRPTVRAYLEIGVGGDGLSRRADVLAWLEGEDVHPASVVTALDTFQKKLLVLARMAVTGCTLAFFDEPAWGLTAAERTRLRAFIDTFLSDMTRVWITHEPESVPYAPQAIVTIANGRVEVEVPQASA